MRTRIIPILLCVTLFLSSLYLTAYLPTISQPESTEPGLAEPLETELLVFENIHYGGHKNQTFDLSLPVDSREEIGLVLFLHGGGWISGDKSAARNSYSVHQSNKAYATASINYRFVNDSKININDIIDDITLALAQIKTFASSYSVNITKVVLSGHSAGGHLSLLYAYKYKDISPIEPVGVFASAPVPDLTLDSFYTQNILGDEKYMCKLISQLCGEKFSSKGRKKKKPLLKELSPVNYISSEAVPTVVLHGSGDKIAPFEGSVKLMEELSKHSVNHELVVFENAGHSLNNEEKKKYASLLMEECVKHWFNLKNQ